MYFEILKKKNCGYTDNPICLEKGFYGIQSQIPESDSIFPLC